MTAWAVTIFVLSSLSGPEIEQINPWEISDKVAHFAAFTVGRGLLSLALFWNTGWSRRKMMLIAIVAISLFGALDEVHQLYTPLRSGADVGDWIADALGAVAGATSFAFIYVRDQRKNQSASAGN